MASMAAIPLQRDIHYPESDGEPMAETEIHLDVTIDLIQGLRRRYRDDANVYVVGDMFLYYVQGDPRAVVSPDVFLVHGVPKTPRRRIYKLWEEGKAPSLAIEVTSDSTRDEDVRKKKAIYERLGIEEYFLFDPLGDYLTPRLQGYRLAEGRYQRLPADPDGSLRSLTTGLILRPVDSGLRLVDAETGEPIPWEGELDDRLRAAEERADREAAARKAAEAELARLRQG
jgi:Uma2 family endonuclease